MLILFVTAKKGISQRFLTYFHSLDKGIGERALGPDQTISSRVTTGLQTATEQAKTVDEQKGISKSLGDVRIFCCPPFPSTIIVLVTNCHLTIMPTVLLPCHLISLRPEGALLLHEHVEASEGHSRGGETHCRSAEGAYIAAHERRCDLD